MPKISRPIIYLIVFAVAALSVFLVALRIEVLRSTMVSLANSMLRKAHHPAAPLGAGASSTSIAQNIRNIDFKKYLSEPESRYVDCIETGQEPIEINYVQYYDLTGDGKEEAIVRASSCYTGTAGPDINSVYALENGKLAELKLNDNGGIVNGKNVFKRLSGNIHLALRVEGGQLVQKYFGAGLNDSSSLSIFYKWNGREFIIDKIQ